jgi:hypothetical protein
MWYTGVFASPEMTLSQLGSRVKNFDELRISPSLAGN